LGMAGADPGAAVFAAIPTGRLTKKLKVSAQRLER
jgi:hypothetical protein